MKKIITFCCCIIIISFCFMEKPASEVLIPKEAIRFRVIANSNSIYDQELKMKVTETIQKYLYNILKNKESISENRITIKKNIQNINNKIKEVLDDNKCNLQFSVKYGYNYFPEKKYKGVKYKKGNYESLLITLGNGLGDNWWCVLFPPLCLMDGQKNTEVEYKFFVSELINKYFNK